MKVYQNIFNFSSQKKTILTLGTFDGVHIGHQSIISQLNTVAKDKNLECAILTFWPHPRTIFFPNDDLKLLNTIEEKTYFLEKGIDKEWVAVLLKNLEYKKNTLQWKSNIPMLAQEVDEVLAEVDFKRIDIPTLLIRGENSNYVKEEDCISFKEKFPNSKIVSVPNSGHWVQVDNPSFFLKEVMEFLK